MGEIIFNKKLTKQQTLIDGLVVYDLTVYGDKRGWFKENWQHQKMTAIGLPDFDPVQNNVSFNAERGVTRGLHAEPWDKFISIGNGKVFGAWVDIREGSPTYGKTFSTELDVSKAIFVPRGVANGFQALKDNTVYMYLVNDHWSSEAQYSNVSIYDDSLGINWPIPLDQAIVSDKDRTHAKLAKAEPIKPRKILITGANGQLGKEFQKLFPDADCIDRNTLDISSDEVFTARRWKDYSLILNAAAYTNVDGAETPEGKVDAWKANATAVANLTKIATQNNLTLVHISSDYVFDGTKSEHLENEPFSPLNVYGQSKAVGDIATALTPKHYILRTSWVIGEGNNFVRTMLDLGRKGVNPTVVSDQVGRLTFTSELVRAVDHLLSTKSPYGTYNVTNDGKSASWAEITRNIYQIAGLDNTVTDITTANYYAGKKDIAPRPLQSTLNLSKIHATGFKSTNWIDDLNRYIT